MYIYIYVNIHTQMCIYIYIYAHEYIHTSYMHPDIHTCVHAFTCVHVHIYGYVYIYTHIRIRMCVYTYIEVCLYVLVYMGRTGTRAQREWAPRNSRPETRPWKLAPGTRALELSPGNTRPGTRPWKLTPRNSPRETHAPPGPARPDQASPALPRCSDLGFRVRASG